MIQKAKLLIFILTISMLGVYAAPVQALFDETVDGAVKTIDGVTEVPLNVLDSAIDFSQIRRVKQGAWENFGVTLRPYYRNWMEYTDNVFLAPRPGKEDVVWHFVPGVSGTYVNEYGRIGAGYEADIKVYTKYSDNNKQDQSFVAFADLYPIENLYLRGTERLERKSSVGAIIDLEAVDYRDNLVTATAGYKWLRWTPEFTYSNFYRKFIADINDQYTYVEHKFQTRLYEDIVRDIRTFLGFDWGYINYADEPDKKSKYYEFLVGIKGSLFWKISMAADVGFHRREFRNLNRKDHNIPIGSISASRKFFNNTTVSIGYKRRPYEVAFENQTFYTQDYFYTNITHDFHPKLRGRTGIFFGKNRYGGITNLGPATAVRDDDFLGVNVGADYVFRSWMVFNIDYQWQNRNSNFSEYDFRENRLTVGLTLPL